jgi:hypothetical protein
LLPARLRFDGATITARDNGDVATVLTSDQRYVALDDAQYEIGEGPCLEAPTRLDPIYLSDAREANDRWITAQKRRTPSREMEGLRRGQPALSQYATPPRLMGWYIAGWDIVANRDLVGAPTRRSARRAGCYCRRMRAMFWVYVSIIVFGIAFYSFVGLTNR